MCGRVFRCLTFFLFGLIFSIFCGIKAHAAPVRVVVKDTVDNSSVEVPLCDGSFFGNGLHNYGLNQQLTQFIVSQPSNKSFVLAGSFVIRAVDSLNQPLPVNVSGTNISYYSSVQYGMGANDYARLFLNYNGKLYDGDRSSMSVLYSFAVVYPERSLPSNSNGLSPITFNLGGNFLFSPGSLRYDGVDMGKLYFDSVQLYGFSPSSISVDGSGGDSGGSSGQDYTTILTQILSNVSQLNSENSDLYVFLTSWQSWQNRNIMPRLNTLVSNTAPLVSSVDPQFIKWAQSRAFQVMEYNNSTHSYSVYNSSGDYWDALLAGVQSLNAVNFERAARQNQYDSSGAEDVTDKLWDGLDFNVGLDMADFLALASYQSIDQDGLDGLLSWFSVDTLRALDRVAGSRTVNDSVSSELYKDYIREANRKLGRD